MPRLAIVLRDQYRLVVGVTLLLTLVCTVVASLLPRQYTAQSQVIAGQIGVTAAAVPAYAVAGESLAQTFSRVFEGDAVQQRIHEELGDAAASAVTVGASPVPATSVILIEAVASTPEAARRAADTGANALTSEVGLLLDNREAFEGIAAQFADASRRLASGQTALAAAQADLDAAQANSAAEAPELAAAQQAVIDQTAEVAVAQAEVDAYQSAIAESAGNTDAANAVQLLASAQVVSDNGVRRFQLLGFTGLVVGAVMGIAAAYVGEWRRSLQKDKSAGRIRRRSATGALPSGTLAVTEGETVR